MPRHSCSVRGYTIIELLIAVMIAALVLAIAIPRAQAALDRATVRSAASEVRAVVGMARTIALAGQSAVAVEIDSATDGLRLRRGDELLMARPVGPAHGVSITATRDSLTYDPFGLGQGAANLSIVIRRRTAAETVFVSRLGRIR